VSINRNAARTAVATLTLSAAALIGLVVHEGYSDRAYPDPTYGTKVPTIGFGSTGPDVKMGDRTDPVSALQRAHRDIQRFEGALKRCVRVPLTQAEYDLYISLTYNIGEGAFCRSGIVRELNAGNYAGACAQILRWRYSNGQDCSAPGNKTCSGLWKRRLDEHARCVASGAAVDG
jgi:lysozyme